MNNTGHSIKITVFSSHSYGIDSLQRIAKEECVTPQHERVFFTHRLSETAAKLAESCEGVCIFVNDTVNEEVLHTLHQGDTRAVFLRCAGFAMIDLKVAKELGLSVTRVPANSPLRRRRVRRRAHDDAQPQDPPLAQPHARAELPSRRSPRLRH
jgi:lactate dehydrogenase-like 2-hydroxyacid dehydrogenase